MSLAGTLTLSAFIVWASFIPNTLFAACKPGATESSLQTPDNQLRLGIMHAFGLGGVSKDSNNALKFINKAADQGYAPSVNLLGALYVYGLDNIKRDHVEAVKWFKKAAKQNYPPAINNMGMMLWNSWGTKQNRDEALKKFNDAAEKGYAPAMNNLGVAYLATMNGENASGVMSAEKRNQVVRWFEKAAGKEYSAALYNLGLQHLTGTTWERNYSLAIKKFEAAGRLGNPEAQYNAGRMYAQGYGVPRNLSAAYTMFELAQAGGVSGAAEWRDTVKALIPSKEIESASKRAQMVREDQARVTANILKSPLKDHWTAAPEVIQVFRDCYGLTSGNHWASNFSWKP